MMRESDRSPSSSRDLGSKQRVRIGVIMNTFVRAEGVEAGGHVHVFEVVERWLRHSIDVVVFAPAFARSDVLNRLPEIEFVSMPSIESSLGARVFPFLSRAALSGLRRRELLLCDALFASSQLLPDVVPLLFARKWARVVFISHILEAPWRRRGPFLRNALATLGEDIGLRVSGFASEAIVTCSHYVESQLRSRGLKQRCFISTNAAGHVRGSDESIPRSGAVCVARLHPVKGIEDLIRAWRIVVDVVPGAELTIVGDGEPAYRSRLQEIVRSLRLDRHIAFAGRVANSKRDAILGSSSFFMFASYEEGFGIAVAEAFTAALPCVTYDLPIFNELFPSGRLAARVGDIEGLSRHAISLLSDPALREKLSKEGIEISKEFTWEHAAFVDARALLETLIRSLGA